MSEISDDMSGDDYSSEEKNFFVEVAHAHLNKVSNTDTLKHFADVWWNLCAREASRASVLDGKAQGLLTLASIVGAVITVSVALGGNLVISGYLRALSIFMFIVAAALAIWALRVIEHAGFNDRSVFEALTFDGTTAGWFPAFDDKDPFRLYLREIIMQRCAVYQRFKKTSDIKARRVGRAQYAALAGALLLALSVVVQAEQSRKSARVEAKATNTPPVAPQGSTSLPSRP